MNNNKNAQTTIVKEGMALLAQIDCYGHYRRQHYQLKSERGPPIKGQSYFSFLEYLPQISIPYPHLNT